ncbi:hypothetical protein HanRHA438_Chr01g0043891 [Helianthus annuus]|nr:hypothetical protein HanRHA438_Chr01g0043891 [Helianthus annuus]
MQHIPIRTTGFNYGQLPAANYIALIRDKYNHGSCWKNIAIFEWNYKINGKGLKSFLKGKVGNPLDMRFWADTWVGNQSSMNRWPHLFNLETNKCCRVADRIVQNQGSHGYNSDWVRAPESITELQECQECQDSESDLWKSLGEESGPPQM